MPANMLTVWELLVLRLRYSPICFVHIQVSDQVQTDAHSCGQWGRGWRLRRHQGSSSREAHEFSGKSETCIVFSTSTQLLSSVFVSGQKFDFNTLLYSAIVILYDLLLHLQKEILLSDLVVCSIAYILTFAITSSTVFLSLKVGNLHPNTIHKRCVINVVCVIKQCCLISK